MLHAVIMAGGTGSRFWPLSTPARPKQFLKLFGEQTMLQQTVERIKALFSPERIWVVTNKRHTNLVAEQLPALPAKNIISEPIGKNTAPCIAAAAAIIEQQDNEAVMAVLPADHLIADNDAFLSILEACAQKADQSDALITIGIQPDRPETGYGYIEFDKRSGKNMGAAEVHKIIQFREKPDEAAARKFVDTGNFLWNSGMFVWKTSTILQQFEEHQPKIYEQVTPLRAATSADELSDALNSFYRVCPSVSIDYGIMEKSDNVFVIPGNFGWNDVGSWKSFYELSNKNKDGNSVNVDRALFKDAENNLVYSEGGKTIALVGVDNLAIVETGDAILICKLDDSQKVKQVMNQLNK